MPKPKGPFVDNETVKKYVEQIYKEIETVSEIEYHSILEKLGWKRPWRWAPPFWSKVNWLYQLYHVLYVFVVFWPLLLWSDA